LNKRVFGFELDGKFVLGFDTGLDARSFAKTKMFLFITQPGYIVYPDGKVEIWQAGGVTEIAFQGAFQDTTTMAIWGPYFPGEELAEVINRKDEALDALRYWLNARIAIKKNPDSGKEPPFPGPAGAFIVTRESPGTYPKGTIFFPPARLLKRTLDAGGALIDAERYTHPDLTGSEEISFCAGAMLYQIFCNTLPFQRNEENEQRQDIREGVFIPPNLAAPGLNPEVSALITQILSPITPVKEAKPRPTPEFINDFFGPPFSKPQSFWVKALSEKEINNIRAKQEQYEKNTVRVAKTRRFLIRNTAVITVSCIVILILALFARSMIRARAELPTTRGMTAIEVVETYYSAFNAFDHTMMQACVTGRAGRDDIRTITSLFVISRVRQAYEVNQIFMPAAEWIETGRPATDKTVFGITDLAIRVLSENQDSAIIEAAYILWMSGEYIEGEDNSASLPESHVTRDILNLVFQRKTWRIAGIERTIN